MAAETVDDLLAKFGDPGRYQLAVLFMVWMAMCTMAFNNLVSLFSIGYYPHNCKLPEDWYGIENLSHPILESGEIDSCRMYINPNKTELGTQKCVSGWEHHPPGNEWTIIQEWDLVCDRRYLSSLATSLYFMGITLGSPVVGYAADKVGRRPVLLTCLYLQLVVGTAIAFSTNLSMYVVLRVIHGFLLQGVLASSMALGVEIFQPSKRTLVAIASQVLWPVMMILLSGFALAIGDWRKLQLVITVPGVITLAYIWLLPESVRWLLAVHKLQKATDELVRLARYNNISAPEDLKHQVADVAAKAVQSRKHAPRNYGFRDLYKKKKMRIISCVNFYFHFAAVLLFYGISYSIPSMGVSPAFSLGTAACVELVLSIAMYWVLKRYGRKKVAICAMAVCSCLTCATAILKSVYSSHPIAQIILTCLGSMGRASVAVYFTCIPMYANELFPTVIRSLGFGVANFFARVGGIIAPQIVLLELYAWKPLPFYLFTVVAAIAAFITIFLPETLNKALPEIPEDVDRLWSKYARKHSTQNGTAAEEQEPL